LLKREQTNLPDSKLTDINAWMYNFVLILRKVGEDPEVSIVELEEDIKEL